MAQILDSNTQAFIGECGPGLLDVSPSPSMPGRACRKGETYRISVAIVGDCYNFSVVNECADPKLNDCHQAAKCTDTIDSFQCSCPPNSRDISPNAAFPGRVCLICK